MKGEKRVTRRQFLKVSAFAGAGLFVPLGGIFARSAAQMRALAVAQQAAQIQLPGSAIPQFIDPLPLLSVAGGPMETVIAGDGKITLTMREFKANMLPTGTFAPGVKPETWVWGYRTGDQSTDPAGTYIGPVIVAERGTPTTIKYVNDLTADHIAWREWTDQTLHWANPNNAPMIMGDQNHYDGPIPAVPHLHGGEVPPTVDGGPDAWFTTDGIHGHAYYSESDAANEAIYTYPNSQEAAMIWFHDHVLGATRLNVYAGLAGAYALTDPGLTLPTGLHPVGLQQGADGAVDYLIPMVIQDRAFDTNGQLFFDTRGINPEHPYWIPELVADTIVVNGKVWPYHTVEPRRYRFLFINGSNARTYEMFLTNPVTKVNGPAMWQIGTDGGYLDAPVKIDPNAPKGQMQRLVLMPGERADVIIDFAGFAGQTLLLRNVAKTPFPAGTAPNGNTTGRIIQFRVGPGPVADASYNPASGLALRPAMVRLVNPTTGALAVTPDKTRQLTLNEVMGAGGPLEVLVNNTKWNGTRGDGSTRDDFEPVTVGEVTEYYSELPNEGDTEVWEVVNLTADAHPIHLHLVQFQLMNRQSFNVNKYNAAYNAAFPGSNAIDPMTGQPYPPGVYIPGFGPPLDYNTGKPRALGGNPDITPYLQGKATPPAPNEAGWKDTVIMYPGQVTRIAVRYTPTDVPAGSAGAFPFDPNAEGHGYVWHCHIIDHEDNEMMRPYRVKRKGATEG